MMQPIIDMSLGAAGPPHEVVLKLQGGDDWELNVWATFENLAQLSGVRAAVWNERRAIAAGTSAGSRVFWCAPAEGAGPETATVLIGHDDETWDIAFLIPVRGPCPKDRHSGERTSLPRGHGSRT
ncbi:hypothetical protein O7626_27630 [Micromonospora sp. WMMD1102]|uniref:hypothetical protein n=1 Tax=Micromonospora sp. WMMD1102 TaxID=3016105 RepID=UPI0024154666|nr:hypothetical protein [Micromonospora sp. WMMD1102]MDG4789651.1 hypothetical protein [Micromonospora sp. WMMD1102]